MEISSPLHLSMDQLAEGLTHCFEGYFMPANFTGQLVAGMVRVEAVDLGNSLVAEEEGRIVGIALVARRGTTARLAAMAIAASERRKGIGQKLMGRVLQDASNRSETRLVLEVISQNEGAIALYDAHGMTKEFRLFGYSAHLDDFEPKGDLEDIPLAQVAAVVRARGENAASWSMSAPVIEQFSLPSKGVRAGGVVAVVSPAGDSKVVCRSMGFESNPNAAAVTEWLSAMAKSFSGASLHLPAFFPEPEFAAPLLGAGMKEEALSQFQMGRAL